jgi:hypothetical protein
MTNNLSQMRADLGRRQIAHHHLTDLEVFHVSCALRGWQVTPGAAAGTRPINAQVWLAAALGSGGRYRAPETPGHPADLHDGGALIDSVILMAIVQRHFLSVPERAWDDDALAEQLGLEGHDFTRAQAVLDEVQGMIRRGQPPLGPGWWLRTSQAPV